MPLITKEEFENLNLMAGTARSLEQKALTSEDQAVFNRDFDIIVKQLGGIVDPELAADLAQEKSFYLAACQVAKGYFNDKPFGGQKAATGQYGMRLIIPQDFRTASAGGTGSQIYSWYHKISVSSSETDGDIFGASGTEVLAEAASEQKVVMAFHKLLSYKPAPKLIMLQFTINDFPYCPYGVEPFSKITKANKLFKLLPMMGRVILHPGGKLYVKGWFDPMVSGTTLTDLAASTVEVEIAPFGLTFAEQAYLNISDNIV